MASLFRARRPAEEGKSGGKILRGRRRGDWQPRPSPYARPQLPALPPPPPPARSPSWLLGLVSGAGKLISSVFRPDSSSSSSYSSSEYSSDEDGSPRSDVKENIDAPKRLCGFDEGKNKPEMTTDCMKGSYAIVPQSESKLAIEKLLSQETFSRAECDQLTKLLESRVVDSSEIVQDGVEKVVRKRVHDNAIDSSRSWLSFKQSTDLPGSVLSSPDDLISRSPRTPTFQAFTTDVQITAVKEAKKWLEDKKLSSNSKVDPVYGPCIFSTDMLHYDVRDDSSPVNLAKSYMHSLSPWQSPNFGSTSPTSPASNRMDICKEGSSHGTLSQSLPPFEDFKRKYLSSLLRESRDGNDKARLKLGKNMPERDTFEHIDSWNFFQNETSKISAVADERDQDVLGIANCSYSLPSMGTSSYTIKASSELHVEDHRLKDALTLLNRTVNMDPLASTDKSTSTGIASQSKMVRAVESSVLPSNSSLDLKESKIQTKPKFQIHFDANMDVTEPLLTEQGNLLDSGHPHEMISASTSTVHDESMRATEKAVLVPEPIECTKLSAADDPNKYDHIIQTSGANASTGVDIVEASTLMELDLNSDAKPQDGNIHSRHGAPRFANESLINGASVDLNVKPSVCEDKSCSHCSSGEQTSSASKQADEHPNEAVVIALAVHGTDNNPVKSENGTKMKSIERVLMEQKPIRHRKRAVVKVKRGKGRGRGAK